MSESDSGPVVRVLSVRQPWAWAIIHAGKDIENRPRTIIPGYRLLIHASRSYDRSGDVAVRRQGLRGLPSEIYLARFYGSVIGMVDVIDCITASRSRWAVAGSYHWVLANPVPVKHPLVITGQQGLFKPPAGWEQAFDD